jgi:hypothetical protein
MTDRTTRWLSGIVLIIIVGVFAFVALSSAVFPFLETLRSETLEPQEGASLSSYDVAFYDQQDRELAVVSILIAGQAEDQYSMSIFLPYAARGQTPLTDVGEYLGINLLWCLFRRVSIDPGG